MIKWKLKGPRFDKLKDGILQKSGVVSVNKSTVMKISKRNPKLTAAIKDYTLFASIDTDVQENLTTPPGLLVYADDINQHFQGSYHIHSIHGPMKGPYHTKKDHAKLVYLADVEEQMGITKEDIISNVEEAVQEAPSSLSSPSSPGGLDSGGTY